MATSLPSLLSETRVEGGTTRRTAGMLTGDRLYTVRYGYVAAGSAHAGIHHRRRPPPHRRAGARPPDHASPRRLPPGGGDGDLPPSPPRQGAAPGTAHRPRGGASRAGRAR